MPSKTYVLTRKELRELVRREVKKRLLREDRQTWISHATNVLIGALGEYYKARYAEANGDPAPEHFRKHWDKQEVVRNHLAVPLASVIKKREHFADKQKAFKQAIDNVLAVAKTSMHASRGDAIEKLPLESFGTDPETLAGFVELDFDSVTELFVDLAWHTFDLHMSDVIVKYEDLGDWLCLPDGHYRI